MAPVRVATSTMCVAPWRLAYSMASTRIKRPSASVLSTSMVLPLRLVTMSPGRWALPPTAFSTAGTYAVTGMVGFNDAIASIAPSTAAPPAISYFIFSMPSAGLMETPPVSKVTAFPIRAK